MTTTPTGGFRRRSFALSARLARREVVRRPWRTLMVAFLVAVPVAAMTAGAVFVRTDHLTEDQSWRLQRGSADAFLQGPPVAVPPGSRQISYQEMTWRLVRTADGARARADITDMPLTDPLLDDLMIVEAGRVPTRAGEVFLTSDMARELGARVGGHLVLEKPVATTLEVVGIGQRRAWRDGRVLVVGAGTPMPFVAAGNEPGAVTRVVDLPAGTTPAAVQAWARAATDAGAGVDLAPRWRAPNPYGSDGDATAQSIRWSWVLGAVAFTVVGIVIASAFAAGARRQLTTLGQLSANGAAPVVLRRVLFLQGTWTGVAGAVLGLGLGAAALAGLAPHRYALYSRDVGPWDVHWPDLVPVVLIGVAAATLSALIPARTISRIPVLAALAGRRPLGRVPHWLTVSGAVAVVGGLTLLGLAVVGSTGAATTGGDATVWALTGMAGGVAILLGACALAPGYVNVLEPLAGRLRGPWRLAARSLARQRTRTGAVVSAVCATAALAVAAAALMLGAQAKASQAPRRLPDNEVHVQARLERHDPAANHPRPRATVVAPPDDVVARLRSEMPGAELLRLTVAAPPAGAAYADALEDVVLDHPERAQPWEAQLHAGPDTAAVIADDAAVDAYHLDGPMRQALAAGGALWFGHTDGHATVALVAAGTTHAAANTGPVFAAGGKARVATTPEVPAGPTLTRIPVTVIDRERASLGNLPPLLLPPEVARQVGFSAGPGDVVLRLPEPLTADQRNAVGDVADDAADEADGGDCPAAAPCRRTSVDYDQPGTGPDPLLLEGLLSAMALLFTLFVVATSLALAGAETRDERDVLTVVGAPPAVLRRSSARKAMLLTCLGAVLAVPVGFLPVVVFTHADPQSIPLVFPWRIVALLTVAVPLLAAFVTTAASAVALRRRPVRISTMAFD